MPIVKNVLFNDKKRIDECHGHIQIDAGLCFKGFISYFFTTSIFYRKPTLPKYLLSFKYTL